MTNQDTDPSASESAANILDGMEALVSSKIFECFSPPPVNTLRGALVPRVLNKRRRRRKIAVEVHRVSGVEECIVRVMDPVSEAERRAAYQRIGHTHMHDYQPGQEAEEPFDGDDTSTAADVPTEFRDTSASIHDGWTAKYRFPVRSISIKGRHKSGVTLGIKVGKDKQVRELIFDSQDDAQLFVQTLERELNKEKERAQAKMAEALGVTSAQGDAEQLNLLVEVVSAWDIPAGDFVTSDPYVVCTLGVAEVHRTKYIPATLDPIWTLKTDSLFLLKTTTKELFLNDGLIFSLRDFDALGKNERLGLVHIPAKTLYHAKGERMTFKLQPPVGKTDPVPGYMAVRTRRASPTDIQFVQEYYKTESRLAKLTQKKTPGIAEGVVGGGGIKSLISKRTRIAKDGKNAGKKQYKIRPAPDAARPDTTTWMTKPEIQAQAMKESTNWVDAGSGKLARLFVEVLGCDDLPNMDTGGFAGNKTDAFVSLVYEDAVTRTDVIDDCLAPRWMPWTQRAFIFHMFHSSSQIFVGVFDYDAGLNPADDHDLIGRVSVDLTNLRPNTSYVLKYNLFTSAKMSSRKSHGTVTLRLRIETSDERQLLLSNMEPPPQMYVNTKTRRDFRVVRFTCSGKYDMESYSMKVINSYIEELLSLQHVLFYLEDAALAMFLWRGTLPFSIGNKTVVLPIHSLTAFVCAILLVERPQLLPTFCFGGLAWIMLATNGYRRSLPDVWTRCKAFQEFIEMLVFGASQTPPHKIDAYENQEAADAFLEQWRHRIAQAEERAAKAYEESVKQQEAYEREMEEIGEENIDISTKRGGVSIDPFKPILFPLQQNLAMVCRYIRHVKYILSWEECYISFWVTAACILLSVVSFFIPWIFIIKWSSRLIVWTIFGPWMKLADIYYFSVQEIESDSEHATRETKEKEEHLKWHTERLAAARVKREDAAKLKAMKKYMFGKFIVRVPVLKEDRYRDLPLPDSTAEPFTPKPRPLSELAMEEVGYRKTRLPGQHLEGDMIPRIEVPRFTEAPVGQATAHPSLLDLDALGGTKTGSDSTAAAYAKIGSVVLAAGILTWFGVPLLGAATEYALKAV